MMGGHAIGQDFGSQIPAGEEEQTLSVERAHSVPSFGAPTRFDHVLVRPGSRRPALHHLAAVT